MATINLRVEEDIKQRAGKALAKLGLDMSSAIKLFLHQVVTEQGLPFVPTRNPAVIRAKWDAEVRAAKNGPAYKNAKEALADL